MLAIHALVQYFYFCYLEHKFLLDLLTQVSVISHRPLATLHPNNAYQTHLVQWPSNLLSISARSLLSEGHS